MTEHRSGGHVPVEIPHQLKYSGADYFSVPEKVANLAVVNQQPND
jgi:hypothetical protein